MVELLRVEEGTEPASFRLIGELDVSNVDGLRLRLLRALTEAGRLTLDTRGLDFVGVDGVRLLVELGEEATTRGTTVKVLNCSSMLTNLLRITVPHGIRGVHVEEVS